MNNRVNHPKHYTSHPSGIEAIEITQHYNFCVGNAIKYCWRAGLKDSAAMSSTEKQIEDLQKAVWYLNREIDNLIKGVYNAQVEKQNEGVEKVRNGKANAQRLFDDKVSSCTSSIDTITINAGSDVSRFSCCQEEGSGNCSCYPDGYTISSYGAGDTMISITANAAQAPHDFAINVDTENSVKYNMNGGALCNGALASGWDITFGDNNGTK